MGYYDKLEWETAGVFWKTIYFLQEEKLSELGCAAMTPPLREAHVLDHILEIDIEPYHPLGISKSRRLGREPLFAEESFPSDEAISEWISKIQKETKVPVMRL